jgi:RNA polymerase sigma-70 factor (ECF subfamily)
VTERSGSEEFAEFFGVAEPRLRRALCSAYGVVAGSEGAAEALAWGWQNWDSVSGMGNPIGYLFRVGQTSARRFGRSNVAAVAEPDVVDRVPEADPTIGSILELLPDRQRVSVVLVHGYGYRHGEVAGLLELSPSTVATHVSRGLDRLRSEMGVSRHV